MSLKISLGTDILSFAIATLQLFQNPENVKISIFPFTLSREKRHIFKSYLTNSEKVFFGWKTKKVGILVKNWNCADILVLLHCNFTTFPTSRKCKNFNFFPLHSPSGNAISSKVFNAFWKTCLWLKHKEGGYSGWKLQLRIDILSFAIATLPLFQNPENVKISIFRFYTVRAEMLYLQKYLTHFAKSFFWLKDNEVGYCGWKSLVH